PELNPIENGWSNVKRVVAESAPFDVTKICYKTLPKVMRIVTPRVAGNLFAHVQNEEDRFRATIAEDLEEIKKEVEELQHIKIQPSFKFLIEEEELSIISGETSDNLTDLSYQSEFSNYSYNCSNELCSGSFSRHTSEDNYSI